MSMGDTEYQFTHITNETVLDGKNITEIRRVLWAIKGKKVVRVIIPLDFNPHQS